MPILQKKNLDQSEASFQLLLWASTMQAGLWLVQFFFLQNRHPWPILRLKSRVQKSRPGVISDFFPQKMYFWSLPVYKTTVGWQRPVTSCFNFSTGWKNSIWLISKTSETCFKILSANSGLTRKACWGWRILSTTKWYWSCYAMSSSPLPTSHSACYLWLLDHAWQPHLYIRHHPFNCTYETYFTESAATSSLVEIRGLRWDRTGCGGGQLL